MPRTRPDRGDAHDNPGRDARATAPHEFVCLRDESDDGTIRFTVSGELDIVTAPELDHVLRTRNSGPGSSLSIYVD
jgi:hypothetical protein